jgi:hypothetical protein
VSDLDARHLKIAVAGKNQGPETGADLSAQSARNGKAHGGVETLRQIEAVVADFDVDPSKKRIGRLRTTMNFLRCARNRLLSRSMSATRTRRLIPAWGAPRLSLQMTFSRCGLPDRGRNRVE